MTPRAVRSALQYFHMAAAAVIAPYIYSPTLQASETYAIIVKAGVVPALVASGLVIWQFGNFRKLFED